MENRSTNTKVGIFVTLGFILLVTLFTWKSGSTVKFMGYEVVGNFDNVGGLLESSDVRYRGYNVGKVMQIIPGPKSILVYVKIKNTIQIPQDSKFRIAFDGLIGQKYLSVVPGTSEKMIERGEVIPGIAAAGIVDFIDEGAKSMQEVQKVLILIRQFLETNTLQDSINKSAKNLDIMTEQLKGFGPKINKVLDELDVFIENISDIASSSQNKENFSATIQNAKDSTTKLNEIMDSLKALTNNPENRHNIEEMLKNLKEITEQLKSGSSSNGGSSGITESLKNIKQLTSIKLGMNAALLAVPEDKLATGRVGLDLIMSPTNQYHFGVKENIDTKEINKYSITGERYYTENASYHFGIIDSQLGAGFGYDFNDRPRVITEFYQPSEPKANIIGTYDLDSKWQIITAAEKIQKDGSDFYIGIGYHN